MFEGVGKQMSQTEHCNGPKLIRSQIIFGLLYGSTRCKENIQHINIVKINKIYL